MKSALSLLLIIGVSLFSCSFIDATAAVQQQEDVVRVRSNEVKLDVVVKDKKDRPVKDLKATDFEVYEDGVLQKIESFNYLVRESTPGSAKNSKRESVTDTASVTQNTTTAAIVALVFDRLSPEARALARKAGLAYAQNVSSGEFTGVYGIDQTMRTYQQFTDNTELVKQGVERATGTSSSIYASGAAKVRENSERSTALNQQISSAISAAGALGAGQDGAGASSAASSIGQAAIDQQFLEMQSRMIEHYETLERDQQGFATINSLLAVISPMQNLPGRKTIIFFSEGLSLPSSVQTKFPAVINAANRANVSIYAIDAAGLRVESGTAEAARELNSLAARRMQQVGRATDAGTNGPYMKALERNEDLLRLDPRGGLASLADETGGFLIHDTNDLVSGLRRINDDMNGYYMLTYVPKNSDFDGRFRHISLKLSKSNLEVQTRKGYYAVEAPGQLPMLDYEAPAIAAARNARKGSGPFAFNGTALSFPVATKPGLALVLAEAPLSAFTFNVTNDKKTYNSDFSIVALIRSPSEQILQKMSQHYPLTGPFENLGAAKKGHVLFYREAQLPAGHYSVELIAFDAATGKVAVKTISLEIAANDESKPRLSSVAVLKRADRLTPEEQKRNQPLRFGELLVYPNLGEPIARATTKQLAFFFTAWPAKGSSAPLQLTMEIRQAQRQVGRTSAELPAPDEHGEIKYASAFPLDKFQPGVYELMMTVSDGKNSVSRSTRFTLQ